MLTILYILLIFVAGLFKSRSRLEAENLFLRHQLNIALRLARPRLQLRGGDRVVPSENVIRKAHPKRTLACSARCQRGELDGVVFLAQLGEGLRVRLSTLGDQVAQLVEVFLVSGGRGNQEHAARR
jgi:hypothetical protein